jgi:hypothetical protein
MQGGTVYGNIGIPLGNASGSLYLLGYYYQGNLVLTGTAKYGNGSNILPHTDGKPDYTNNTITGR